MEILKLGLKFCPTPKSNIAELKKDLKEFERKFRLIETLDNKGDKDDSLVKNKSTYFPNKQNNTKELNSYFENLWNLNLQKKTQNHKQPHT